MLTHRIGNGRLSATFTPFGATLVDLRLTGWPHPLVLGFDRLDDYALTDHYAGAVIGRHANRIAGATTSIDGVSFDLTANSGGNHLHGGTTGLARQHWAVASVDPESLTLTFRSPDGHEGYPGNVDFEVRFEIVPPATLRLSFRAQTDKATLINLCQHPYFNFSGAETIFEHRLQIAADTYLVATPDLVPTGERRSVAASPFDFRTERPVGSDRLDPGFNNNYCLSETPRTSPEFAARLSVTGGPAMELWTTQTGMHLYDGYKLRPGLSGLEGRTYGPNGGICLEAQNWPDSPNHPDFPSAVLHPTETYSHTTEYRFSMPE